MSLLSVCTSLAEDIQSSLDINDEAATVGMDMTQAEAIAKAFERHHIDIPPSRLFLAVLARAMEHCLPNSPKSACFVFELAHMLYHMIEAVAAVDGADCAKH